MTLLDSVLLQLAKRKRSGLVFSSLMASNTRKVFSRLYYVVHTHYPKLLKFLFGHGESKRQLGTYL